MNGNVRGGWARGAASMPEADRSCADTRHRRTGAPGRRETRTLLSRALGNSQFSGKAGKAGKPLKTNGKHNRAGYKTCVIAKEQMRYRVVTGPPGARCTARQRA